jgi:hypothetical protein
MEDDKRTVAAVKQAVYYRNYRRARDRALVRLAQEKPEDYRRILLEERERDEKEGKTWSMDRLTIIPPTNTRVRSRSKSDNKSKQAIGDEVQTRNVGGEA